MLFDLSNLIPLALLTFRLIVAVVFFDSGKSHILKSEERAESIGMSPFMTIIIGIMEVVAAVSIALGIFTQIGAIIIIVIMLGAIKKKIIDWKIGFYADKGYGWHYDLIFMIAAFVILVTNGGKYVIIG